MNNRIVTIAVVAVFILSLVPLVWMGLHARPSMDDYSFSASSSFYRNATIDFQPQYRQHYFQRSVRYAVVNGNIFTVGRAVINTVADNYMDWQGTFSAIALFSIHPGVLFRHGAYPLTMLLTLLPLIAATAFLAKQLMGKGWLAPSALMLIAGVQFMPHVAQGLFWYNGAVFYTFFYSLMLFSLGLKLRFYKNADGGSPVRAVIFIAFLDFFIAGGNLVTALLAVEINILLLLLLLWQSRGDIKGKVARWRPQAVFTAASGVGFLINVMAPGNAVRAGGGFGGLRHAMWSISQALSTAIGDIVQWTTLPVILLLIIALPFMWRVVKDMEFDFKYPALVALLTFLLFASQNAPTFYAISYSGPPRLRNIIFFMYLWLLYGNAFYAMGWLSRNVKINYAPSPKVYMLAAPLLLIAAITTGYSTSTGHAAAREIRQGYARRFLAEHRERISLLEAADGGTVVISAYTSPPLTLVPWWDGVNPYLGTEMSVRESGFVNRAVADFFGAEYVICLPPSRTTAIPMHTVIDFEGRQMRLEAYLVNDNRYFRLRDMGYLLGNVFDVGFTNGQFTLAMGQPYTLVGGEVRNFVCPGITRADFNAGTILVDNELAHVISFTINGEVFHQLRDLLDITGLGFESRYGTIYLYTLE